MRYVAVIWGKQINVVLLKMPSRRLNEPITAEPKPSLLEMKESDGKK